MTKEIKIANTVWETIRQVSELAGISKQSLANVALQLYFSNEENRVSLVNFIRRNNLKEKNAKDLEEMIW